MKAGGQDNIFSALESKQTQQPLVVWPELQFLPQQAAATGVATVGPVAVATVAMIWQQLGHGMVGMSCVDAIVNCWPNDWATVGQWGSWDITCLILTRPLDHAELGGRRHWAVFVLIQGLSNSNAGNGVK